MLQTILAFFEKCNIARKHRASLWMSSLPDKIFQPMIFT